MKRRSARAGSMGSRRPARRSRGAGPSVRGRDDRRVVLLVATRKGAFIYYGDSQRKSWRVDGPHFLGHIVNHLVLDPRDGRTLLAASRTGHLGPTIFRTVDMGRTWQEAAHPPAFPKAAEGERARAVDYTFWLSPAHPTEPNAWYAGTSPPALFRSEDGGMTWASVEGWNDHSMYLKWNPPQDGTPDGPILHSVLVDPRDPNHMYLRGNGGTFESPDKGRSWRPLNKGVEANFVPGPEPEYGQDTHCLWLHPLKPDRLYQQSHCGIYRLDRPGEQWERIGNNMPREIGDIGFPIVLHPRDPDTVWVFPMDGTSVWPRTSPQGRPAAYRSRDAGETWERQDRGFPRAQAWFTVKRQGFSADECDPVGLYLGTTSGELWMSANEGASWRQIAAHLPEIYAVVAAMSP
ncbi:MAG TPA: hypothetical protein VEC38_04525 [Candidatus Binataceae bacterium]|nr:hypothetical protein [Candidatus Binataceae bacterium]